MDTKYLAVKCPLNGYYARNIAENIVSRNPTALRTSNIVTTNQFRDIFDLSIYHMIPPPHYVVSNSINCSPTQCRYIPVQITTFLRIIANFAISCRSR